MTTSAIQESPQQHLMERLMAASALPGVVYHYTDAHGFLGIVDAGTLWLTNMRYLNDTQEFRYTLDLAAAHLDGLLPTLSDPQEITLVEGWRNSLTTAAKVPVYVACFSERSDDLSQWRAYGRGGGFAIGIRPLLLMKATLGLPHPGAWLKCVYAKADQEAFLAYATNYLLTRFRAQPIPPAPDDVTLRLGFEVEFFGHVILLAACFKHPAFAEEVEWRLIVRQDAPHAQVALRHFRASGRMLVPYLEAPLLPDGGAIRFDQVIVGPNPHMDLAVSSVTAYLGQRGMAHDGVVPSQVPYRDW